jgi:hypothetical protein
MTNWKIGDTAHCVNTGAVTHTIQGTYPAIRLHMDYTVNDVHVCSCGTVSLDIGLANPNRDVHTSCSCRASIPNKGVHWAHASRFVKKVPKKEIEAAIAEAVAVEEYELAGSLKKDMELLYTD